MRELFPLFYYRRLYMNSEKENKQNSQKDNKTNRQNEKENNKRNK